MNVYGNCEVMYKFSISGILSHLQRQSRRNTSFQSGNTYVGKYIDALGVKRLRRVYYVNKVNFNERPRDKENELPLAK